MSSLGIDVGGTSVKAAIIEGDRVTTARSDRYTRPARDELLGAIKQAVGQVLEGRSPTTVGLCLPGRPSPSGLTIDLAVNVPGLEGLGFEALVAEAMGGQPAPPHRVFNDGIATAYDYWTADRAPGRLFALVLGTGVGAAVLDDGQPLRHTAGACGHFGQLDVGISVDGSVPIGPDGGRGSLEAYIGAHTLEARLGDNLRAGLTTLDDRDPAVRALVRAIRVAHAMFAPDRVVLLGGVGLACDGLVDRLHAAVSDGLTSVARPGWTLAVGRHPYHAAVGAARLAADGE